MAELADMVSSIGPAMEPYARTVLDNCVDGSTLLSFASKEEAAEFLEELGVCNKVNQRVLLGKILEVIEAPSGPTKVAGGDGGGPRSPRGALPHVPDKITQDPRSIMQQIFAIHGDDVDPNNVKTVIAKIGSDIRSRVAAGWANGTDKFDCFTSTR